MRHAARAWIVCAAGVLVSFSATAHAHEDENDAHILPGLSPTEGGQVVSGTAVSAVVVPIYSSRPQAAAKVYLDFDGDTTMSWGVYVPATTPAYDIDSDPNTFSLQELENIHQIWSRVAEAYSSFNVDVTTVNPGSLNDRQAVRVVIGGDGKNGATDYWVKQRAGGVAYLGSFTNGQPNTVFVFPGNLANGSPKPVADASAHEIGHAFGLNHQSTYDSTGMKMNEYNPGTPEAAPFMGFSYKSTRGLWYEGTSTAIYVRQNDVNLISSAVNGFGYRADDHGNSIAAATPLGDLGPGLLASGVIETSADSDFFSFTITEEAEWRFTVSGAPFGGMLDPSVVLFSGDGVELLRVSTASLSEVLDITLPPGEFDLAVLSAGNVGDIGQYFLTAVPEPLLGPAMLVLAMAMIRTRRE